MAVVLQAGRVQAPCGAEAAAVVVDLESSVRCWPCAATDAAVDRGGRRSVSCERPDAVDHLVDAVHHLDEVHLADYCHPAAGAADGSVGEGLPANAAGRPIDGVRRATNEGPVVIGVAAHGRVGCLADGVPAAMDAVGAVLLADACPVDVVRPVGVAVPVGAGPDDHPGDGALLVDVALDQRLIVGHVVVGKDVPAAADVTHRAADPECATPDWGMDCAAKMEALDSGTAVPWDWEPVEVALDCSAARGTPSLDEASFFIHPKNT